MMRQELDKHYKALKISATNQVKQTKAHINDIKTKFFNMDLPRRMEIVLRSRIRFLSIVTGLIALVTLFIMVQDSLYLIASLLTGFIAMVIDFFIEYRGVSKRAWDYPTTYLSFKKIPIEVPLLFFSCGILTTFALYCFSIQPMVMIISTSVIAGLSYVQIALFLSGIFFMLQYFRGAVKSIVFWALPISIA
ncbi:MAG: hypothetical protein MUO82_09055 [Candidatus Thermoplasmatota archaeon]|nr:hypothetical protein [Candidatus Thermoplasmatota archaeon]